MSTQIETVAAETREEAGKGPSRELRRNGLIPAVVYGKNKENLDIAISEHEITLKAHKSGFMSKLLNIEVQNKKHLVIPYSLQLHPVTDRIEHVDFMYVNEDSEVKVHVALHFINQDKSIGVKRGGVINIVRRDVELFCKPHAIPTHFDIDLSNLNIHNSVHINDLELPEGARLATHENITLVTIVGRAGEEEAATPTA